VTGPLLFASNGVASILPTAARQPRAVDRVRISKSGAPVRPSAFVGEILCGKTCSSPARHLQLAAKKETFRPRYV